MRIGIDIDNTVICYDGSFASLAKEEGFLNSELNSKEEVKTAYHSLGLHNQFTRLQGKVYGEYIAEAELFEGCSNFITRARTAGYHLFLVSHKTTYPILGRKVDLRNATKKFLEDVNVIGCKTIQARFVYFEDTLEAKIERIKQLQLDAHIDDLAGVLMHPKFPAQTRQILFDPNNMSKGNNSFARYSSWKDIQSSLKIRDA